jgi:predicted Zn-dependent peptidase
MVQKTVLNNGIRILTERIPGAFSATVGFWVASGSRHEDPELGGISPFLEHMVFKGTSRRSAPDIAREIDSVGGALNAFTSYEFSCYYAKVAGKNLPLAVDLLSDIVLNSVFDLDELEKERRVVLQEIRMLQDTPDEYVHELFARSFWNGHPLGRPILGTQETVTRIEREHLVRFRDDFYGGNNLLICAAGDVRHEALVEQIEQAFAGHRPGQRSQPLLPVAYHTGVNVAHKDLEQVHFCLGCRAPEQSHPKRMACNLLNLLIGGSMSSRLFQILREERGMAYSVYSYLNSHSDTAAMVVYAGTSAGDVQHAIGLVLHELSRIRRHSFDQVELQAAKEQVKGQFMLSLESSENRMTRLAKNEIYLAKVQSPREVLDQIQAVSVEDMQQIAETFFQDRYLVLQMIGQVPDKAFPLVDLTLG